MGLSMTPKQIWTRRAAVGLVALALPSVFLYAETQFVPDVGLYTTVGLLACFPILIGIALHRPARPWAWFLIAGGNASFVVGDIVYFAQDSSGAVPFPGLADVFYLGGYPLLVLGLALLRQGGQERSALINAAIVATSAGLAAWAFFVEPYAIDPSLALPAKLVSIGYPVGDLFLFASVVWLFLSAQDRKPSTIWLLVSTFAVLGSDVLYLLQTLEGTYQPGWVDTGYIVSYLTFGAAGLDPSMAAVSPREVDLSRVRRGRVAFLFVAALLGPGLLGVMATTGRAVDMTIMSAGTIILFSLVLARMYGLMNVAQRATALTRARERDLRITVDRLERAEASRKRLLEQVLTAAERERSSLAADLHDGPIQHLTTLALQADLAARELETGNLRAANDVVQTVQTRLNEQVTSLRTLMVNLRPPVLDERGLAAALRDTIAAFAAETEIEVSENISLHGRLDRATETIIYRVGQEALANVRKHARAARVEVLCTDSPGEVHLEVSDDGVGFNISDAVLHSSQGHIGLVSMRERVELAGGKWELASAPGRGTSVKVWFVREERGPD